MSLGLKKKKKCLGRADAQTGDVLFLSGITMTIGARRTFVFFFKRKQMRGNLFFFGGVVLVFFRWAVIGMGLQVRGRRISLFNFFTTALFTSINAVLTPSKLPPQNRIAVLRG